MAAASLQNSICKLAIAGEQAGFTVEQMIRLLNAGVTVDGLLRLIEWRLGTGETKIQVHYSEWVM